MNLVYHKEHTRRGSCSSIDAAILDTAQDCPIHIACPYLDRSYLQRLVVHCGSHWQLLTDMAAWLQSLNRAERAHVLNFVTANGNSVRDCRHLHAKVIIGSNAAIVGSANLTHMGVCRRPEMCVRIEDMDTLSELKRWFELHWSLSADVDLKRFSSYAKSLPDRPDGSGADLNGAPPSAGPVINTTIKKLPVSAGHKHPPTDEEREELRGEFKSKLLARLKREAPELSDYVEKTPCTTTFPASDRRFHFEIRVEMVPGVPDKIMLGVVFCADGPLTSPRIQKLDRRKTEIQKALATDKIEWGAGKGKKSRRVSLRREVGITKRSGWSQQHKWAIDSLGRFHDVFTKEIKRMRS